MAFVGSFWKHSRLGVSQHLHPHWSQSSDWFLGISFFSLHLAPWAHRFIIVCITGAQSWICSVFHAVALRKDNSALRVEFKALQESPDVRYTRICGQELPACLPETLRIGSVTLADLKSIMTFSPLLRYQRHWFESCRDHNLRSISCHQGKPGSSLQET